MGLVLYHAGSLSAKMMHGLLANNKADVWKGLWMPAWEGLSPKGS